MKLAFPHLGNAYIAVKGLLDDLRVDYLIPPRNEARTLELGERYAPEGACLPLKITLGQLISCHEAGADTALMIGGKGPCRQGYFGEIQRNLLRDAGYPMEVLVLGPRLNAGDLKQKLEQEAGAFSWWKLVQSLQANMRNMKALDRLEELTFMVRPREKVKGSTDRVYDQFHHEIVSVQGSREISRKVAQTIRRLEDLPVRKAFQPLKVGIIGEIYTSIDPCPTQDLERQLGNMGLEVHRPLTISYWMKSFGPEVLRGRKHPICLAVPYIPNMIGGHAQDNIGHAIQAAQKGFDGLVQIYPLGCMPEIVTQSILPRIEEDFSIPILTLVIDNLSGQAGYLTRAEAFVDLLENRRRKKTEVLGRKHVFRN